MTRHFVGRQIIAAAALALALGGAAGTVSAQGRTQVVFTIDVESNESFSLPEQVSAVCKEGVPCGLMEISRQLKARGWSGTFFLSLYEYRQWGVPAMRDVAVGLATAGQDVELHTHPHWAYDPARWGMSQYSLEEQTGIVRDGVKLLHDWTGQPIVAHRTGAYAADANTMLALERNGVLIDSSVFWQTENTKLDGLNLLRNLPTRRGLLTEIPVSVYRRAERPTFLGWQPTSMDTVRKIDPDWFTSAAEARSAMDALVAADVPVVVVFLHSFSFMSKSSDGSAPTANAHTLDVFRAMLDHIASLKLDVLTMRELATKGVREGVAASDNVPTVEVSVGWARYTWRRAHAAGIGRSAGAAGALAVLVMAAMAVAVVRRRTKGIARAAVRPDTTLTNRGASS